MPPNKQPQRTDSSNHPIPQQKVDLDPEMIKQIVAQQTQKLQNEAQRLRLEEMRLAQDGKLAEKSLELNSHLIKESPGQKRKTIRLYVICAAILIVIFLSFIGFCLYEGKEEFIIKFLTWITNIFSLILGIGLGRLSKNNKSKENNEDNTDDFSDAEVLS